MATRLSSISSEPDYPRPATAWLLVALLTLTYVLSSIDRYILGLLIQPIKDDIGLRDGQIGWLIGPAFATFYATMGLPLGWLVDRRRRTWLIAAGVAFWSLATAASGLARTFTHLFFARMGVGVGEAVLSPAAFSIIADSFPQERRGKPIAVYSMAIALGSGITSLTGAAVLTWAKGAPEIRVPIVGVVEPWQATFFAVGLPGLLVAAAYLFVREPARRQTSGVLPTCASMRDMLAHVGARWRIYAGFVSLVCVMTITAYSQAFMPATFERTWGWPPERYATYNGIAALTIGPATFYAMGALSDRIARRGNLTAPLFILFGASLLLVPTAAAAPLMPGPWSAFALLCLNTAAIGAVSAVAVNVLLAITPAAIRGRMIALYYMIISLSGLLLGPTTVGLLSTHMFGEADIRYAMALLPVIYGLVPLLLMPSTLRLYRAEIDRLS
jgi:MFS family permease